MEGKFQKHASMFFVVVQPYGENPFEKTCLGLVSSASKSTKMSTKFDSSITSWRKKFQKPASMFFDVVEPCGENPFEKACFGLGSNASKSTKVSTTFDSSVTSGRKNFQKLTSIFFDVVQPCGENRSKLYDLESTSLPQKSTKLCTIWTTSKKHVLKSAQILQKSTKVSTTFDSSITSWRQNFQKLASMFFDVVQPCGENRSK